VSTFAHPVSGHLFHFPRLFLLIVRRSSSVALKDLRVSFRGVAAEAFCFAGPVVLSARATQPISRSQSCSTKFASSAGTATISLVSSDHTMITFRCAARDALSPRSEVEGAAIAVPVAGSRVLARGWSGAIGASVRTRRTAAEAVGAELEVCSLAAVTGPVLRSSDDISTTSFTFGFRIFKRISFTRRRIR